MTRLISNTDLAAALVGTLTGQQQHMVVHIATDINADVENGFLTPSQVAEALERLATIIRKKDKK